MLQPDIIVAERGDMVTLVCSTNIVGKTFPRGWVINGTENDLSQGASFYEVNGLNISFEQMFTTRIKFQCYFLSQTEKVYSNNATLVPEIESIRGKLISYASRGLAYQSFSRTELARHNAMNTCKALQCAYSF
jgi:hypothetical protein